MLSPELGCSGWRDTLQNTLNRKTHLCLSIRPTKPFVKPCRQTKLPPQNKTRKTLHKKSHPGYSCTKSPGKEKGQFHIDFPASNFTQRKTVYKQAKGKAAMVTWLAGHGESWELQTATSRLGCLKPKVKRLWAGRLSCNKLTRRTEEACFVSS